MSSSDYTLTPHVQSMVARCMELCLEWDRLVYAKTELNLVTFTQITTLIIRSGIFLLHRVQEESLTRHKPRELY